MIALMLAAILSQTGTADGPGHVLTGASPGEGEARWMVGARVVETARGDTFRTHGCSCPRAGDGSFMDAPALDRQASS
jgi:hypothetical protein